MLCLDIPKGYVCIFLLIVTNVHRASAKNLDWAMYFLSIEYCDSVDCKLGLYLQSFHNEQANVGLL